MIHEVPLKQFCSQSEVFEFILLEWIAQILVFY